MAIKQFTAQSITEIEDGRIAEAIQQEMNKALEDCRDRPLVKKPRTINLKILMTPAPDDRGDVEGLKIGFKINSVMPPKESRELSVGLKHDGRMFWNDMAPDNHNQRTIDESER